MQAEKRAAKYIHGHRNHTAGRQMPLWIWELLMFEFFFVCVHGLMRGALPLSSLRPAFGVSSRALTHPLRALSLCQNVETLEKRHERGRQSWRRDER